MYYEDCEVYDARYLDLSGRPVKRTPWTHPYSYDDFVIYKSEDFDPMDIMVYHDRMLQWDRETFEKAAKEVWPKSSGSQMFSGKNPMDINRFLNMYFGKKVKLTAVLQGCNAATGFPYWIFAYTELEEEK